jgi:FkbM family methyltransferase
MRPPIWYLEYYLVPRLPPSHLRAWLEAVWSSTQRRDHPLYRGFDVRYRPGRYSVRYHGVKADFRSGFENRLALGEITGYLLKHKLERGDVVVDAGAYEGVFSVLASRLVGPEGGVIAFEPDSQNRRRLESNLRSNRCKNVTVVAKGLWSGEDLMSFCESGGDFSCISSDDLDTPVNADWNANTAVEVTSLDAELEHLGLDRIDFLKADVEGAEIEMLKGARRTLEGSDARAAIASYHIVDGRMSCYRVEDALKAFGYEVETNFPHHPTTYGWSGRSPVGR